MTEEIHTPIFGVRRWTITPGGLAGIFKTRVWEPSRELAGRAWAAASCEAIYIASYWGPALGAPTQTRTISICGRPPGDTCACGFYGLFHVPGEWSRPYPIPRDQAFGVAEYAGDVIVAEGGLRAELARPVHIVIIDDGRIEEGDIDRIAKMWDGLVIERAPDKEEMLKRVKRLASEFVVEL